MKKKIITAILILFVLIGCGQPPEGTPEINLLKFIYDQLTKLDEVKNDREGQKNYFKSMMNDFNALFAIKEGSQLIIDSKEAVPNDSTFAYTLKNNRIIVAKPLYITSENKEMVISFDRVNWYSTKNDIKNNIEGIRNDYSFNPVYDNGLNLSVNYEMAFSLGENPKEVDVDQNKPIIDLKKGMIFGDQDQSKVNTDLRKVILFVPAGTVIFGSLKMQGNLVESNTSPEGKVSIRALKDIYIYLSGMKLSMSFDKSKWNVSLLSFEIDPVFNIRAVADNRIFFNINTTAIYDENKKSLSVVKLLLRNL